MGAILSRNSLESLTLWKGINFVALVALPLTIILFFVIALISFPYQLSFPANFLLARTTTVPNNFGNHSLIEAIEISTIAICVRKGARVNGSKAMFSSRRGYLAYFVQGLFPAGVHESLWYLPYLATYGFSPQMLPRVETEPYLRIVSLWLPVSLLVIVLYLGLWRRFGKRELTLLAVTGTMYLIWYLDKFPITLLFGGPSALVYDPLTNAVEILSWLIPCACWIILLRFQIPVSEQVREDRAVADYRADLPDQTEPRRKMEGIDRDPVGHENTG